ncbi:MAG: AsmA-like C-terminal domain-containing protein, partial [Deltaproteobacteria bacterium]
FTFDLDLKAEVAELPAVLHHTVHDEAFLSEVDRFSDLKGRAEGHLHLGDHLRHPVAQVTVDALKASGRYARVPWLFQFEGGRLEVVSNRKVFWRNVKAVLGPHRVAETTGAVTWGQGIQLDVKSFQGTLAAGPLFREINRYHSVHRKLSRALSALTGTIEVTSGTVHGPWRQPERWQYDIRIQGKDLVWASPLLGPPVSTRMVTGSISSQEAIVTASENSLLGRPISLQGRFNHHELAQWHGWVNLQGTADQRLASWVKEKRWVPPALFPQTPCTLDDLRIGWDAEHMSVSGGIIAGDDLKSLPRVDFELRKTRKDLTVKRVAISAAGEQGLLALDLPGGESAGFELNWRGNLDGRTVDALLESNRLLKGRVAGVCTFRYTPGQPQQTRLVGTLQADDIRLPLSGSAPLTIKRLKVNGDGASLDIPLLALDFSGEQASAKGRIVANSDDGLDLDLDLASPSLSWSTLTRLQKSFRDKLAGGDRWKPWDFTGQIRFNIDQFMYAADAADSKGKGGNWYRWLPLQGSIDLQPGERWQVDVDHAGICGLAMSGTWSSTDGGTSLVRLRSDPQSPPAFEKVMPCLGIKQDLLVGQFDLDVTLHGRPGHWTAGKAKLQSAHGNIRRLTLLSKIFRVVNLTDLFTTDGSSPVAGGLPYSMMDLEARVADNHLVFEKMAVHGEGLNLFGNGKLDLSTFQTDLTILISPLKTIDTIVSWLPLIGRAIGGKDATLVTLPVGVKGPISDPSVMVLSPKAVGKSLLSLVKNTLSLPYNLFSPIFSGGK